jgi:hypothetical protein
MMLAADYEVMSRYALEDAARTSNPTLKALYEAHSLRWLELAAEARRLPDTPPPRAPRLHRAA